MLKAIFDWFKTPSPAAQAPAVQPEAVPYKVETPVRVVPVTEAAPAEVSKPANNRVEATTPPARKPRATPAAKPAVKKTPARKPAQK